MNLPTVSVLIIHCIFSVLAKSQYIVDLKDVDWNITTKHNCNMSWQISQPTRGSFAISGILDFKEDINTDNCKCWVNVYYSTNAVSYMLTPFRIPPTVGTECINFLYKEYLMDILKKCCKNGIDFEETFVSPLTKRRMICENCIPITDNLPTHLRMGFYRLELVSVGEVAYVISLTVQLLKE